MKSQKMQMHLYQLKTIMNEINLLFFYLSAK